jgi:hypothetical protein
VDRFSRIAALLVVVVTLVLPASALAGCGGAGPSSGTSGTSYPVFTRDNWGELATDPDGFKGARVDIVGSVLGEPVKKGDVTYFQMWPHPTNVDWFAVIDFEGASFTIADGDYVHVLGTVRGKTEGKIPLLAIVDAVAVRAETAEVVDESAAAPPALRTVEVGKSVEQHRLVVTLDRVEFAANETRVYVTVSNDSTATASFNGYKTRVVQAQTEYKPEDLSPYPWVEATLPPGMVSSGVVLLKAMDPAQATELSFDSRTDDYQLEFGPYVFMIAAS